MRSTLLSRLAALVTCLLSAAMPSAVVGEGAVNQAFEPLTWLAGEWQAEFRPHGGQFAAPTMAFTWGDANRSYLLVTGTKPAPDGGLEPEYETTVVWHPVEQRFVFLGVYRSGGGKVTEDGTIDVLDDGSLRLNMNVHYRPGATLPFSDGETAGPGGHTLEFRRTFERLSEDRLRGSFRIRRGDDWEEPRPGMEPEGGFPWRRVGAAGAVVDARGAFFQKLSELCGSTFAGSSSFPEEGPFAGKPLVARVAECDENEIRIPFSVGEDHSRTWILTRGAEGLLLKHDHRHEDGSPDEITMYGGWATRDGSALSQSFPADEHTRKLLPEAATNVWTLTLDPERAELTYYLERHGKPRFEAALVRSVPAVPD